MRATLKIFLATLLLATFNISDAATCPPIATAIQQIGHVSLAAGTPVTGGTYYTGTSTYDSSKVDYYTTIQPTAVTPNHQIQLLEAALIAPTLLSSANDTTVKCAYLGTPTAPFDSIWGQSIVITSSGTPTPPPAQSIQVSTDITGLPSGAMV
jgi:hypothetical protein